MSAFHRFETRASCEKNCPVRKEKRSGEQVAKRCNREVVPSACGKGCRLTKDSDNCPKCDCSSHSKYNAANLRKYSPLTTDVTSVFWHFLFRTRTILYHFHISILETRLSACLSVYLSIHPSIHGSTSLCWTLAAFSVSWSFKQSVGLLGREISPSQSRYLHAV
jgi:hypothetical protein